MKESLADFFIQKASLTRKLTWAVFIVLILFVVDLAGTYWAHRTLYDEIALLHENRDFSSALAELRQITDILVSFPSLSLQDSGVYSEIQRQAQTRESDVLALGHYAPAHARELGQIQSSLNQMFLSFQRYFAASSRTAESTELSVGKQFGLEASEGMGRLRITVDGESAAIFERLYRLRYRPLLAGAALTSALMLLLLLAGLTSTRKLGRSLSALLDATREVTRGKLNTRAPVLSSDEIGSLAHAFNSMTAALEESTVSRTYVEAILESLPDMFFAVRMDGTIQSANRIAARTARIKKSDLMGLSLWSFLEARPGEPGQAFSAIAEGEVLKEYETDFRPARGAPLPISLSASPIRERDGHIAGVVCIAHDISERKASENEKQILAEVTAKVSESIDLRQTLQNSIRAVVSRMGDWGFIQKFGANGSQDALEIYSSLPENLPLIREWLASRQETLPEELRGFAQMSSPLIYNQRTLGRATLVSLRAGHVYGDRDRVLYDELMRRTAIAIENSRLYQEAREALANRDEFLSIASHELKTPLTALALRLQLLNRQIGRQLKTTEATPSQLRQVLHETQASVAMCMEHGRKLAELLDELLDLTRIRLGQLRLSREETDLEAIAKTTAERFKQELSQKGIPLTFETQPARGFWDPMRMEQIVSNLLSNAIKYGGGSPILIRIETHPSEESVRLIVMDRGQGVSSEMREKIFERFERAGSSSRTISGFGLGLYICRQIIEAHGGTIRVASPEGAGASFIVDLPVKLPEKSAASA